MYRSTAFCPPSTVAWAVWVVKSEPLERLRYHTSCPGLCINSADLFPFQATHQVIESIVSGTVPVSNASLAPQKRALHTTVLSKMPTE